MTRCTAGKSEKNRILNYVIKKHPKQQSSREMGTNEGNMKGDIKDQRQRKFLFKNELTI